MNHWHTLVVGLHVGVGSLVGLATPVIVKASEIDRLIKSYGNLETVAGIGEQEDGNFWKASFEGMAADAIELSNPHMTMADGEGNFYIADKESHSILKVDQAGIVTTYAGTHSAGFNGESGPATEIELNSPNGLFVFPDKRVYVLDFLNRRVRRIDRQGQLTTVLQDDDGFGVGRGLWVSPDESSVYYNGPGGVMRWTAETGSEVFADGFSNPGNIALDPDGRLIVTDRGTHKVYRIESNGTKTVIAGNGSSDEPAGGRPAIEIGLEDARGIAIRPDGSYFVCTQKGGDVVFVDTQGIANIFIAGQGSGNTHAGDGFPPETTGDKISEPRAISLAPNGDLIITTNDKGFIRVVRAIQPPENLKPSRVDGGILLEWNRRDGIVVDVETSATLDSWNPAVTDLDSEAHSFEFESSQQQFFRLRAHRP